MKGLKEAIYAVIAAALLALAVSLVLIRPAKAVEWKLPTIEVGVGYETHNTFGKNPAGYINLSRCTVGDWCVGYLHGSSIPLANDLEIVDMYFFTKKWTIKSFWSK